MSICFGEKIILECLGLFFFFFVVVKHCKLGEEDFSWGHETIPKGGKFYKYVMDVMVWYIILPK